ncbi:Uncharacterized conserved protein, DUF1501 family [Polaromonas sp. OV174]|uniref:DUF1501 domain-containing protein n=1 Tax=Polaromonas sp. OV174 TaxID=1855300 RepID=UPI0008DFEA66|nr:DUF1501 domain-containing protein [Polaromonas sp. OV174]SFB95445.1 Uncharacterized conserved protein, DUF1501 family [Polaromonas sp. OV174]
MQRRHFTSLISSATGAALLAAHAPGWAQAMSQRAALAADRILILVELKGGNDGLNTVVPYADASYYQLRPVIGIKPDAVIKLDAQAGLHPALQALLPLWEQGELGIVQGVGYPQPNLSHFRSIEIWETGSKSSEYLQEGWVTRGLKAGLAGSANFSTEGVLIGSSEFGALAGARAVSLNNPEAFVNQSRLAHGMDQAQAKGNAALQYVLQVENDINQAAQGLRGEKYSFLTPFSPGAFGNGVKAAAQVVASQKGKGGVPVITLTLGSFDTHQNQPGTHANLLKQLAEGLAALKGALTELGAWDRTLVMTFSEFGRRPRQNNSNGTDHGTAAPHFVAGGAVRGGLYGQAPDLSRLDGTQNVSYSTDFRQLYASVAKDWWGVKPDTVTRGHFEPLKFLKT